jgi:hypothetical protein
MATMARNYLAIPGASTAPERLFSIGGHISSVRRARLTPKNIEAIQMLRSAYMAGDVSVDSDLL